MNKTEEGRALILEEQIDVLFLSESHEREDMTLEQAINLENYEIISSMNQRKEKGGRPALVINKDKYFVRNLTNTVVDIPWGVEAMWAVISPKNVSSQSKIKHIVLCSFYSKPDSKKKTLLLNHISQTFHQLGNKYGDGVEWIMCADSNHLNLDSILRLCPEMRQVVTSPTRLGPPPAMLDPVITTLAKYYQTPVCLPPLQNDPGNGGRPSDHMIVTMTPIDVVNNKPARSHRFIKVRPAPQSGLDKLKLVVEQHDWSSVMSAESGHEKAEIFQQQLLQLVDSCLPEKTRKVASDDQCWITQGIKDLDRRKKREFHKNRRSPRYKMLNKDLKEKIKAAKSDFYMKMVRDLKVTSPSQWYTCLKRMTNYDRQKSEEVVCDEINDLSDQEQADRIAASLSSVSQLYQPLKDGDIHIPHIPVQDYPQFSPVKVQECLQKLKLRKSTSPGDISAKIIRVIAPFIALWFMVLCFFFCFFYYFF